MVDLLPAARQALPFLLFVGNRRYCAIIPVLPEGPQGVIMHKMNLYEL